MLNKAGQPSALTRRHCEVLALVARGMSNAQIAHTLYIAEGTVERHLVEIFQRLGVASRTEATWVALSNGVVSLKDTGNPQLNSA